MKLCLAAVVVGLAVAGCGAIPSGSFRNAPLCPGTQIECIASAGARDANPGAIARSRASLRETDAFKPKAFVGLALSGGGSRAANFSLATMQHLEALGIMQHVTAISSTSGGGLAGAYYALNGHRLHAEAGEQVWGDAKERFRTNFRDRWLLSSIAPWSLIRTTFTHSDRTDLMAGLFDDHLFGGARYAKLEGPPGPRRPIWIANATNLSDNGRLFAFSEEEFNVKGSRIDSFPISQAVAASAAFPGVFNSVTLRHYKLAPAIIARQRTFPDSYVHLMDGGPADNLGVETLLRLAASASVSEPHPSQPTRADGRPNSLRRQTIACLLIVVDAFPDGVPGKHDFDADPRGFTDHLVDSNFMGAFDAFLLRRRADFLSNAGLLSRPGQVLGAALPVPIRPEGFAAYGTRLANDFSTVVFPLEPPVGQQDFTPHVKQLEGPIPPGHGTCAVWHIALDNIASLPVMRRRGEAAPVAVAVGNDSYDPAFDYRAKLRWVVSQIATDFKLTGPQGCDAGFLQDALYAAARVAVLEGLEGRTQACRWLAGQSLATGGACTAFAEPMGQDRLALPIASASLPIAAPGSALGERRTSMLSRPRDQAIRCLPPAS